MKANPIRHVGVLLAAILLCFTSCSKHRQNYVIGVSQCGVDPWRMQLNEEMTQETMLHNDVSIVIKSVDNDPDKQEKDIQEFIDKKVDILIVSPCESKALTPIVDKAYDAGIPVLLVDRRTQSKKYTAFVGSDNYAMGRLACDYIANKLGGRGNIVEILGKDGATSAMERHLGLLKSLKRYPGIKIIATVKGDWSESVTYRRVDSLLDTIGSVDLFFAHNDLMANGARRAATSHQNGGKMCFVGVDALLAGGQGVDNVAEGKLDASLMNPTAGDLVVRTAIAIMKGTPYKRETILPVNLVDSSNARILMTQSQYIAERNEKIEALNSKLEDYDFRYSSQRMLLYACIVIVVLVVLILIVFVRNFRSKRRLADRIRAEKDKVEEQRDELADMTEKLEEAMKAKLAFYTNVSHDFRTPLTLIIDPVEQLMDDKSIGPDGHNLLDIIHRNAKVLLHLVNEILDFRKYEVGKLTTRCTIFDMAAEIDSWTAGFKAYARRKQIAMTVDVADPQSEAGYRMYADRDKLERILYNLLANAFKFSKTGGQVAVTLSTFLDEAGGEDGKKASAAVAKAAADSLWMRLTVRDNGVGMNPESVKHVFERFYQADNSTGGSGLGLSLVKAFTEIMGGRVSVSSEVDKGSAFTVEMPMRQSVAKDGQLEQTQPRSCFVPEAEDLTVTEEAAPDTEAETPAKGKPETKEGCVLIIDDSADIRTFVRMALKGRYDVVEAENGEAGLEQAVKKLPDVAVCDVMMPVMDGLEFCRRLKADVRTSHIPVIMLTAYAMEEHVISGYESGADSYLSKPFSSKLLLTRIRNLIDGRKKIQGYVTTIVGTLEGTKIARSELTFLDKFRAIVEEQLGNSELTVDMLGDKIGLSRVQLYRKTKSLTGMSPNEIVRITRLKKADVLLRSTDKTVSEVAYDVGFATPSYFTKCYKEHFGINPNEARNAAVQEKQD